MKRRKERDGLAGKGRSSRRWRRSDERSNQFSWPVSSSEQERNLESREWRKRREETRERGREHAKRSDMEGKWVMSGGFPGTWCGRTGSGWPGSRIQGFGRVPRSWPLLPVSLPLCQPPIHFSSYTHSPPTVPTVSAAVPKLPTPTSHTKSPFHTVSRLFSTVPNFHHLPQHYLSTLPTTCAQNSDSKCPPLHHSTLFATLRDLVVAVTITLPSTTAEIHHHNHHFPIHSADAFSLRR